MKSVLVAAKIFVCVYRISQAFCGIPFPQGQCRSASHANVFGYFSPLRTSLINLKAIFPSHHLLHMQLLSYNFLNIVKASCWHGTRHHNPLPQSFRGWKPLNSCPASRDNCGSNPHPNGHIAIILYFSLLPTPTPNISLHFHQSLKLGTRKRNYLITRAHLHFIVIRTLISVETSLPISYCKCVN